jgi:hypothetical protein
MGSKEINDTLINGTSTRFEIIIESIRSILFDFLGEENSFYGCIAFYIGHFELKNICMKVFPLNPTVVENNFPSDIILQNKYLGEINKERLYKDLHHLDLFRQKYKNAEHVILNIAEKDSLNHSTSHICGKSWDEYIEENTNRNILDLLFFESGQRVFNTFPLPVFSSPSILLILPFQENKKFTDIVVRVRESINFYLFEYLLKEIQKDLRPNNYTNRDAFIQKFIDEFCKVTLPISYINNNNECRVFDWYGGFCKKNSTEFCLKLDYQEVKFYFPTFHWNNKIMFHESQTFKINQKHIKKTLESLFELMFSRWKTLNSDKIIIEQKITPVINDLEKKSASLTNMMGEVSMLNKKIDELKDLAIKIGGDKEIELDNEFYLVDSNKNKKFYKFRYNGKTYTAPHGGINSSLLGWEYLHIILSRSPNKVPIEDMPGYNDIFPDTLPVRDKSVDEAISENNKMIQDLREEIELLDRKIEDYETENRESNSEWDEKLDSLIKNQSALIAQNISLSSNNKNKTTELNKELKMNLDILSVSLGDEYDEFIDKISKIKSTLNQKNNRTKFANMVGSSIRSLVKRLLIYDNTNLDPLFNGGNLKIGVESRFESNKISLSEWRFE